MGRNCEMTASIAAIILKHVCAEPLATRAFPKRNKCGLKCRWARPKQRGEATQPKQMVPQPRQHPNQNTKPNLPNFAHCWRCPKQFNCIMQFTVVFNHPSLEPNGPILATCEKELDTRFMYIQIAKRNSNNCDVKLTDHWASSIDPPTLHRITPTIATPLGVIHPAQPPYIACMQTK